MNEQPPQHDELVRVDFAPVPYDSTQPHESMITLRLPRATHRVLYCEAHDRRISLNAMVLSKVVAEIQGCELVGTTQRDKRARADRLRREAELQRERDAGNT